MLQGVGCKGAMWMIDPDYRPNLLQALRKTPYHPFHQLQMLACPQQSYSAFSRSDFGCHSNVITRQCEYKCCCFFSIYFTNERQMQQFTACLYCL